MTASSARRILDRCGRVFDPHGPAIWVRRPRINEPKTRVIGGPNLEGVFPLRPGAPGRPTDPRRKLSFRNLLTDLGLDQMGSGTENFRRCAVGTGTADPDVTDTTLQNQIAATTSTQSRSSGNEGGATAGAYGYHQRVFRFGQGVAAGNLAEIGIGGGTGGGTLSTFSRARILDPEGNPTTLTVLSDEFLDVTYEIRCYVGDIDDVQDEIEISGIPYETTSRPSRVGQNEWRVLPGSGSSLAIAAGVSNVTGETRAVMAYETQTLAPVDDWQGSFGASRTSLSDDSYVAGSFYRDSTATWSLTAANFNQGIGLVSFAWGKGSSLLGMRQTRFSPRIPKTNAEVLAIPLRHEWARRSI